jgi:hypothetical protein
MLSFVVYEVYELICAYQLDKRATYIDHHEELLVQV